MSDGFVQPENLGDEKKAKNAPRYRAPKSEVLGKITGLIGGGNHAQNSLVLLTITSAFISAIVMALILLFRIPAEKTCEQGVLFNAMKDAWGIFVPIITLSLGYAFGKGRN